MKSLSQSPVDAKFVQNPYPFYDKAREHGHLFFWTDYNMVCVTSHEAVTTILKDRRFGREIPNELYQQPADHLSPFYNIEQHSMLELEPPRHTRLRGLVLRAFTSRRIAAFAAELEDLSNKLIDNFPDGPFDLIDAYGKVVPVIIICRLLGVPEDRSADLLKWSNAMVAMYQAKRNANIEANAVKASKAFDVFIRDHIALKRAVPADDLLSELIAAEQDGDKLTEDEMVTTCILLLNAGHEATVHTLGNGIATLLRLGIHSADERCIEEILRFDPPLHMFTRWVYEELDLFGHTFKRGDKIGCLLAAANRDPMAYSNPNEFDPTRRGPANTSFGAGIHFCVGAPLARLELVIAIQILLKRCPHLRLAEQPTYANVYHFHGLTQLLVER